MNHSASCRECRTIGWRTAAAAVSCVLAAAIAAQACNVPVFRFALERWRADSYRATLFHRGPLTEAQRMLLAPFDAEQTEVSRNVALRLVDVAQPLGDADQQLYASQAAAPLPRLVVRYPEHLRIEIPVWSGPLEPEAVAGLLESPVRQELIRRLTEGQTAVWILLESGSPEVDEGAAATIEAQLRKLEQFLSLPELTDEPADALLTKVPLQVAFSLLRVSRDDPREQALVGMLIRSEPDLAERNDPMAFPVFGRGRALLPLVGPGITAENIHDSAAFLVGPCSCEIKELNPGFDLLLAAAWEDLIYDGEVPPQALVSDTVSESAEPVLVPIPDGSRRPEAKAAPASPVIATHGTAVPAASPSAENVLLILAGMMLAAMLVLGYAYP